MRKFFLLPTAIALCLSFSYPAAAHVLQTDGSIGAVMHVSPDDDPIAGEPSDFFFEFKDKEKKFDVQNCTCTFTVFQAGKEIYSQLLSQNTSSYFTFPQKDIYQITVTGKPNSPDSFQPFTLSYDIRVARQTAADQTSAGPSWFFRHIIHFVGAGSFAILVLVMILKEKLSLKK